MVTYSYFLLSHTTQLMHTTGIHERSREKKSIVKVGVEVY